ncbi:hypothetical protein FJZ53_03405 [Candidatus Woesearchaeota archaeon]|nr:hypothetical protein [Candidatus Woesearchaeota archaeon]
MSRSKSLLERELEGLKGQGRVYNIPLSDLVMMQMVGDFDSFIESLTNAPDDNKPFKVADKMIKETKEHTTTAKLFPSIIDKTIQAQVGEKHAALRELGQNGIDAYDCSDTEKPVVFDISKQKKHIVLRARDYGCGMDLKGLIKNLLVPYNSGKEFDITKIGEHGIGWYSIMDLAEVVRVATRPKDSEKTTRALVYKKRGRWMSSILLESGSGFSEDLNREPHGTEVTAYISETGTNEENIRNFLFQYLGMVDKQNAQIGLGKELVNSVKDEYGLSVSTPVIIEGKSMPLTLGVSKRKMDYSKFDDTRFKHRDLNLEKIVYTQNGLFIKYDGPHFEDGSVHEKLIRDLSFMGLDFWVDVPQHATLTKGRNNIIADHGMSVLDGMYQAFENLFLDVLLTDNELLYHPSQVLLESISNLFNKSYADTAEMFERGKYSLKRRLMSAGAAIGSKSVDVGTLAAQLVAHYAKKTIKYPFTSMPNDLRSLASDIKNDFPRMARWALRNTVGIGTPAALFVGALYGGIKLQEHYGWTPFIYIGAGLGALGIYWLTRKSSNIKEWYHNLGSSSSEHISFKEVWSDTCEATKKAMMYLLNQAGLYVDVEKKREKKREQQRKKISEKYLSKMKTDEFFKKVLNKKIIPAELYSSSNSQETTAKKPESTSLGGMFKNLMNGFDMFDTANQGWSSKQNVHSGMLNKSAAHLSIDDIIDLYLKGSLKYSKDSSKPSFRDGDYFVDYHNPIVNTVISKLEHITSQVKTKYDVKVLEDHLDNFVSFTKEASVAAYMMSPVGILHVIAVTMFGKGSNPFRDYYVYYKPVELAKETLGFIRNNYKSLIPFMKGFAKGCVRIPYSVASTAALLAYEYAILPGAKAANPVRYPGYVKEIVAMVKEEIQDRKLKKEQRAEAKKNMLEAEISAGYKRGFFSKMREFASDCYQNSIINELFGYGILAGEDLNNLGKKRLDYITKLTGIGRAYYDFTSMVEGLDKIVCDALDKKPFNVVLGYSPLRNPTYNHNGFMLPDKEGTLHICLEKMNDLINNTLCSYGFGTTKENALARLSHTVLDALIHQRVHDELGEYRHSMDMYDYSFHSRRFFDTKEELRRKVVDHLEKSEIQLADYVEKFFPPESKRNKHYFTTGKHLSKLAHMTRRRLMDEAYSYQHGA